MQQEMEATENGNARTNIRPDCTMGIALRNVVDDSSSSIPIPNASLMLVDLQGGGGAGCKETAASKEAPSMGVTVYPEIEIDLKNPEQKNYKRENRLVKGDIPKGLTLQSSQLQSNINPESPFVYNSEIALKKVKERRRESSKTRDGQEQFNLGACTEKEKPNHKKDKLKSIVRQVSEESENIFQPETVSINNLVLQTESGTCKIPERKSDHLDSSEVYAEVIKVKSIEDLRRLRPFTVLQFQRKFYNFYNYKHYEIIKNTEHIDDKEEITVVSFGSPLQWLLFFMCFQMPPVAEKNIKIKDLINECSVVNYKEYLGDEEVQHKIEEVLKNNKLRYNLLAYNCEHLINYCKIGKPISFQIRKIIFNNSNRFWLDWWH